MRRHHGEEAMEKNGGIRDRKVGKAVEYLQNALFPLSAGERLPGFRTIMKETGVGRRTVANALKVLAAEGIIHVDPRRGIFRLKPTVESGEIRLLHCFLSSPEKKSFFGTLFEVLLEEAAGENRKITVENAGMRSKEEICGELIRHGISNCIVCGAETPGFAEFLKDRMDVCMELLPRHTAGSVISLRDSPEMTTLQFDYLRNLGYTRIGYFHFCGCNISLYPVQVLRLLDYYRLMAEHHLRVDPDWVFYCMGRYENLEEGLKRAMASTPPPQVLIVPGSALKYLYPLCRKLRIRIGTDLAIFSCDDAGDEFTPEATTITNDPKSIAESCWRMFRALSRGEAVQSRHTELRIRVGQTVPRLGK